MENLEFLFLTWNDIQRLIEKVVDRIIDDGYKPDIIIAISRGGFNPARILCDQLNVRKLASVQVTYYTGVNTKGNEPIFIHPLNAYVSGLKVLIVDDVADSGDSLKAVKKYVNLFNPSEIRTVTLHYKPWSIIKPNYFAEEVSIWIIYPWEICETILDVRNILIKKGVPEEKLKNKLLEIGFKEEQILRYSD